ncbi:MAG: hypothetical protein JW795_11515 [Chitinivibrionales bacterium]|nr:hypothetical protein [Chitinivibrionales bacterium]
MGKRPEPEFRHFCLLFIAIAVILQLFCSPVTQLRPLQKGQTSLNCGFGGPILKIGSIYTPLPMLSCGYNRGMVDSLVDISCRLYLLQALFKDCHIEIGGNIRPFYGDGWSPDLILSPKFSLVTNFVSDSIKFYPDLCLTTVWSLRSVWLLYAGVENYFELSRTRYDGSPQQHHWLPAPYVGVHRTWRSWGYQAELRLFTPTILNTQRAPKNIGINDYGMMGVYLGVDYTFHTGGSR